MLWFLLSFISLLFLVVVDVFYYFVVPRIKHHIPRNFFRFGEGLPHLFSHQTLPGCSLGRKQCNNLSSIKTDYNRRSEVIDSLTCATHIHALTSTCVYARTHTQTHKRAHTQSLSQKFVFLYAYWLLPSVTDSVSVPEWT